MKKKIENFIKTEMKKDIVFIKRRIKMKKLIITVCLLTVGSVAMADTYVNGYYRQNGTYVNPYYRSNTDGYTFNNYSTNRNLNPYYVQPIKDYNNNYNLNTSMPPLTKNRFKQERYGE